MKSYSDDVTSSPFSNPIAAPTETTPGAALPPYVTVRLGANVGEPFSGNENKIIFIVQIEKVAFSGNSDEPIQYHLFMQPPGGQMSIVSSSATLRREIEILTGQAGVYYNFAVAASNDRGSGRRSENFAALVSWYPSAPQFTLTGYTFTWNTICAMINATVNDYKSPVKLWKINSQINYGRSNTTVISHCNEKLNANVKLSVVAENGMGRGTEGVYEFQFVPPPYAFVQISLTYIDPQRNDLYRKTSYFVDAKLHMVLERLLSTEITGMELYFSYNKITWDHVLTVDPTPFLNQTDNRNFGKQFLVNTRLPIGKTFYYMARLTNHAGSRDHDVWFLGRNSNTFNTHIWPSLNGTTITPVIARNEGNYLADLTFIFPNVDPNYPLAATDLQYPLYK